MLKEPDSVDSRLSCGSGSERNHDKLISSAEESHSSSNSLAMDLARPVRLTDCRLHMIATTTPRVLSLDAFFQLFSSRDMPTASLLFPGTIKRTLDAPMAPPECETSIRGSGQTPRRSCGE